MILVTLGTHKYPFKRLLDYLESSNIDDEIIVQAGYTAYESSKLKIFDFVSYEEMDELVNKADIIITAGGTGSTISALKKGKIVIVCTRLAKYGEVLDDHGTEMMSLLYDLGYILKLDEDDDINEVYDKTKTFQPKLFESNTEKYIEFIKDRLK